MCVKIARIRAKRERRAHIDPRIVLFVDPPFSEGRNLADRNQSCSPTLFLRQPVIQDKTCLLLVGLEHLVPTAAHV